VQVEEIMKRVEVDDPASISMLARFYCYGLRGLQQDRAKAMELYVKAAELGCSKSHNSLADIYRLEGDMKKAKFHLEAGAMAGDEFARLHLGGLEGEAGNWERAIKHWTIAASAGCYWSMQNLRELFEGGAVSRETINSALTAYNNSCKEMRSEARDAYICVIITDTI
jgi:TPR repeat protein